MALRPVSELGLVDLTDLASPTAPSPTAPSPSAPSPRGPSPKAAPAAKRRRAAGGTTKRSPRASERTQSKPRASARPSRDIDSAATQLVVTPRVRRAKTSRAVAEKIGMSVTCVVAGAAGVLLGRAAIRG